MVYSQGSTFYWKRIIIDANCKYIVTKFKTPNETLNRARRSYSERNTLGGNNAWGNNKKLTQCGKNISSKESKLH